MITRQDIQKATIALGAVAIGVTTVFRPSISGEAYWSNTGLEGLRNQQGPTVQLYLGADDLEGLNSTLTIGTGLLIRPNGSLTLWAALLHSGIREGEGMYTDELALGEQTILDHQYEPVGFRK